MEDCTNVIIGCAIEVHRRLGPGLLERVYSECLKLEFMHQGLTYEAEKLIPITYRDVEIPSIYRLDFLVENSCIVELKAIEKLLPVHDAQLLTYMKLCNIKYGLILNFNTAYLKDGIKRLVL